MPNNRLPYFPFYVKDFVSDSKVESMSTLAVGSYTLLLCKAWHEDPPGSIPDADPLLARWARITLDQWMGVKQEVLAAFSLGTDLRWHQKRLRLEYDKLMTSINDKTARGRKAARSRWINKKDAHALHKHSKRNADAMPGVSVSESESSISLKSKRKANYEEIKLFCSELNLPDSDSEYLFNHWEGNGWTNGGEPIKDWKRTIQAWKSAGHLPSQKNSPRPVQAPLGVTMEDLERKYLKKKT